MRSSTRTVIIDTHPGCCDVQLTRGWARQMLKVSRRCAILNEFTFDFVAELRSIAHNARLPFDMLKGMKSFHDGYVREANVESPVERVAKAIVWNIGRSVPEFTVDQLQKILGVCLELGTKLSDLRRSPQLEFPETQAWLSFLNTSQFQITLWGMQRTCFVSIYNAYESFATSCIASAKKQPNFRRRSPDKFRAAVIEVLDEKTYEDCFNSSLLKRAELIRHSLSHAGGRKTAGLAAAGHVDRTADGRIQVTVMDVRDLLLVIEKCALQLAIATARSLSPTKPK